jgi:hypothetical protein
MVGARLYFLCDMCVHWLLIDDFKESLNQSQISNFTHTAFSRLIHSLCCSQRNIIDSATWQISVTVPLLLRFLAGFVIDYFSINLITGFRICI